MDIQYQHPELIVGLLALPFLALLFWYVLKWKQSVTNKIGDERLVKELTRHHSSQKFIIKFVLGLLALTAIVIGMVNPIRAGGMEKVERKGVDVMIALDVSNSMLAEDIKPNRLEKAKQLVNRLIAQLPDDRVGLVLFAGRAYMQMPLTTDHAAAGMYVQNATPGIVPTQGTMIADALKLCTSAFNTKERKYKSIVMITDGEDHDPESQETAKQLSANGVIVNTVGVGSALGTPIPDQSTGQFKKDADGNTVLSKLNEEQLKQLAATTNGVYVNAEDINEAVNAIVKRLSTIEETSVEDAAFKDYIHYFQWFIGAAILLLIAEFFVPERKQKLSVA
jgi:Ca-activated chloride channel family protein